MEDSLFTIAVISDPQIDLNKSENENEIKILKKCFTHMNVDTVAVCGDITENALPQEIDAFFDIYKQYCPSKNLLIVPGNMDDVYTPDGQNRYFEAHERFFGKKIDTLYFSYEAANCFLIGISPEPMNNGAITDNQLSFLDKALFNAMQRGVPAIIFSHYQLTETININWKYAALNSDSLKIKPILEKYGVKIIFFSGHTHRGLISEIGGSVITKGNVTYVSTPSICKPDIEHYKADNENIGTGYIVDITNVYIHIRGFDFLNNEWLEPFDWKV